MVIFNWPKTGVNGEMTGKHSIRHQEKNLAGL